MTELTTDTDPRAPAGFVEKAPLERYVPPAKPSLVGLTRVEAAYLAELPLSQREL